MKRKRKYNNVTFKIHSFWRYPEYYYELPRETILDRDYKAPDRIQWYTFTINGVIDKCPIEIKSHLMWTNKTDCKKAAKAWLKRNGF